VLDDLMSSMYSASCSTTPMAPDLDDRPLPCRRLVCSGVRFCFRARISPASIMAAIRALDRDGESSFARETIGSLKVDALTAATKAMHSRSIVSFILKIRTRCSRCFGEWSSQFTPSTFRAVLFFTCNPSLMKFSIKEDITAKIK
jgi:hypothetical protein